MLSCSYEYGRARQESAVKSRLRLGDTTTARAHRTIAFRVQSVLSVPPFVRLSRRCQTPILFADFANFPRLGQVVTQQPVSVDVDMHD